MRKEYDFSHAKKSTCADGFHEAPSNLSETVDKYMKVPYRIEIKQDTDEGGYVAALPELKGCLSCGNTVDEAITNLMDAKREWIIAAIEREIVIPLPKKD